MSSPSVLDPSVAVPRPQAAPRSRKAPSKKPGTIKAEKITWDKLNDGSVAFEERVQNNFKDNPVWICAAAASLLTFTILALTISNGTQIACWGAGVALGALAIQKMVETVSKRKRGDENASMTYSYISGIGAVIFLALGITGMSVPELIGGMFHSSGIPIAMVSTIGGLYIISKMMEKIEHNNKKFNKEFEDKSRKYGELAIPIVLGIIGAIFVTQMLSNIGTQSPMGLFPPIIALGGAAALLSGFCAKSIFEKGSKKTRGMMVGALNTYEYIIRRPLSIITYLASMLCFLSPFITAMPQSGLISFDEFFLHEITNNYVLLGVVELLMLPFILYKVLTEKKIRPLKA